jgi:perosamine synthetase
MLPYGRQHITEEDILHVCDVLRSDHLTTGPAIGAFESAFADYVGAQHAVAVCNGTAALHLALLVAGIGPGDRVFTSPNTFLASANCAAYVGATPDFVDIDPVTYNLSPQSLAANWRTDTKAVIPVHYAGGPADMESIAEIARANGAGVIEDACHAVGGSVECDGRLKKIGGHRWADISTFSFHAVKAMTSGEGGMLVTDNEDYAMQARLLRTHGMIRDLDQTVGLELDEADERGPWYYEMHRLGFNFRITDIQCALGLSQLSRLDQAIARRREIVAAYNEAFEDCEWITTPRLANENLRDRTSWHLYTVQIDFQGLGHSRSELMAELKSLGVGTQVLYIPVHLQPWYRQSYGYGPGKCPQAESYYQRALSLPLFPAMTDDDVRLVVESVYKVLSQSLSKTNCH